jgi:hypothetical protein
MAVAQVGRLIKINGTVPPAYALRPFQSAGVQYPETDAIDLAGRPVGARGWPWITLTFDRISMAGLEWWESQVQDGYLSAVVTSLTLPDRRAGPTRRVEGYLYHRVFTRGILWRPIVNEGGNLTKYRDAGVSLFHTDWLEGTVTIRITELGRNER